jgi:hypothetical protein
MKRFLFLLRSEIKLLLTHKVVLIVSILQPALLYGLMSVVFVEPTFSLTIQAPQTTQEQQFIAAMKQVGIESGVPYIDPEISDGSDWLRQYISMRVDNGMLLINQSFGNINTNLIKNFRNRVTAAALIYWQEDLGNQAIRIHQQPLLPKDVVYIAYFGMALIPMGIFLGTAITSAMLTAYEFENGTILEMYMSPRPDWHQLSIQFLRMIMIGLLSASINICAVGWISGVWPTQIITLLIPICLLSLAGGALGTLAGFITRKALPSFLFALVVSLLNWLFGDSFGLASGFAGWYELFSYFAPNRYMVEILFPHYYHVQAGSLSVNLTILWLLALLFSFSILLIRGRFFKGEIR